MAQRCRSKSNHKEHDLFLNQKFNASVETRVPVELDVKGRIPACVAGTLYRTGPGHYKIDDQQRGEYKISHWFGV